MNETSPQKKPLRRRLLLWLLVILLLLVVALALWFVPFRISLFGAGPDSEAKVSFQMTETFRLEPPYVIEVVLSDASDNGPQSFIDAFRSRASSSGMNLTDVDRRDRTLHLIVPGDTPTKPWRLFGATVVPDLLAPTRDEIKVKLVFWAVDDPTGDHRTAQTFARFWTRNEKLVVTAVRKAAADVNARLIVPPPEDSDSRAGDPTNPGS